MTSTIEPRCLRPARDRRAVGEDEAVRRVLVGAADVGIAQHARGEVLDRADGLHAEPRHHEQQVARRLALDRGADLAVDGGVGAIEDGAERWRSSSEHVAETARLRVAQVEVAGGIEALVADASSCTGRCAITSRAARPVELIPLRVAPPSIPSNASRAGGRISSG